MLNNKYIIKVSNVVDDDGEVLPDFYMGERHVDLSVLSHDIFEFDSIKNAEKYCNSPFINNYNNAVFTIQKVKLTEVKKIHNRKKDN